MLAESGVGKVWLGLRCILHGPTTLYLGIISWVKGFIGHPELGR